MCEDFFLKEFGKKKYSETFRSGCYVDTIGDENISYAIFFVAGKTNIEKLKKSFIRFPYMEDSDREWKRMCK